jgi:hypothetical protein
MYTLPEVIVGVMKPFENLFDPRTWRKAQLLAVGAILSPGKRTVSAALSALGMSDRTDFSLYHHVLNRARWEPLNVSRVLLTMLIELLHRDGGTLVFGMDETIERRNGKRISALGWYRDATRSSHSHTVKTSGLRWVSMMWLSRVPFAGRHWALPFLTALAPSSHRSAPAAVRCQRTGAPPKTLIDIARQMMMCLRRWLPEHDLVVVADGGYSVKTLLRSAQLLSKPVIFVTRLRMDASLHAPAPPRRRGQRGRPRVVGDKLPGLAQTLDDPSTVWETLEVGWYGSTTRTLQAASGVAVWYNRSKPTPAVHIRWVLVRDPLGELSPQTLACTDTDTDPRLIVEWFALRWQVEVTFQELRTHMGVETQRQWSDSAIARTTPALFGLFSVVTVVAHVVGVEPRSCAWYDKSVPTFADAIAATRRHLWSCATISPTSSPKLDMVKIPRDFYHRMLDSLCYAA